MELTNTRQWREEPVMDYINRWRNLSLNCKDTVSMSSNSRDVSRDVNSTISIAPVTRRLTPWRTSALIERKSHPASLSKSCTNRQSRRVQAPIPFGTRLSLSLSLSLSSCTLLPPLLLLLFLFFIWQQKQAAQTFVSTVTDFQPKPSPPMEKNKRHLGEGESSGSRRKRLRRSHSPKTTSNDKPLEEVTALFDSGVSAIFVF